MYNIVMEELLFEWDENKNEINKKKHGLSFETAREVFYDSAAIIFDDPDHSVGEERFLIIGTIKSAKICIVSHCYRDSDNILRAIANRNNDLQSAVFDGGAALCAAKRFVYTPSAKATMWLWRLLRSLQSTTCCALQ